MCDLGLIRDFFTLPEDNSKTWHTFQVSGSELEWCYSGENKHVLRPSTFVVSRTSGPKCAHAETFWPQKWHYPFGECAIFRSSNLADVFSFARGLIQWSFLSTHLSNGITHGVFSADQCNGSVFFGQSANCEPLCLYSS